MQREDMQSESIESVILLSDMQEDILKFLRKDGNQSLIPEMDTFFDT